MRRVLKAKLEETFRQLASDFIEDAEAVPCELWEFRDGLKVILSAVRERLEQVTEEIGE